jgi:purine nucleosidase
MEFPVIPDVVRLSRLEPPAQKIRMVLDTDTYNEIDDQFAVVYALLSPEKIHVEAIYAAPFHNDRSSGPADGMEKSYDEILRLLDRLDKSPEGFVFKGSTDYLAGDIAPQDNPAVRDLIQRALARPEDEPLYVVAIGAITNVASAILIQPEIIKRIVVVWLGGHALYWPHTREFNLQQDVPAARVIFNCGVPVAHIPCQGVTTHLFTTLTELNAFVRGRSRVADYLCEIYEDYYPDHYARSKVIWDIATIAYLIDANWVPTNLVHSPIVTDQVTWSIDQSRHLIRSATFVHRDPVFRDLFDKLKASGST